MRIKMGAQCCGLCPYELQILQCKDNIKAASLNKQKIYGVKRYMSIVEQ